MISSLILIASCQDADWTCDECLEGGSALGTWLGNEENIQGTTDLLLFEVCPQHPDPAYCEENLPSFWAILGPIVFKEHYCHICDDREECPHSEECAHDHPKAMLSVPTCDSCKGRINGACDALAWEETITAWIAGKVLELVWVHSEHISYSGLTDWCQTSPDVNSSEECQSAVEWGVPLVFKSLVGADRGWVDGFCMVWGACA